MFGNWLLIIGNSFGMKKIYSLFIALVCAVSLFAQDIHYSQFYNAPLLLNPALTGFTPGVARIGVNYRNQWFSNTNSSFLKPAFMTTAVGFDMPVAVKTETLGVGLFLAADQSGANTFSTVIVQASLSYIKALGKKRNHRLSAGFQVGLTHQTVKTQNFQFANQFDQTNEFNSNMSADENIAKNKVGYLNLNFGLLWYGKISERFSMYTGASFYNVTTPKNDILAGQKHDLYWRMTLHTGLDIKAGQRYHVLPSILFMHQGVSNQLNTGLGFGVDLTYDMAITLGLYNRINPHGKINGSSGLNADAIIPYLGLDLKGFKIGLSYDATVSHLKNAGHGVGAFELALGYTIKRRDYNLKNSLVCPRF